MSPYGKASSSNCNNLTIPRTSMNTNQSTPDKRESQCASSMTVPISKPSNYPPHSRYQSTNSLPRTSGIPESDYLHESPHQNQYGFHNNGKGPAQTNTLNNNYSYHDKSSKPSSPIHYQQHGKRATARELPDPTRFSTSGASSTSNSSKSRATQRKKGNKYDSTTIT